MQKDVRSRNHGHNFSVEKSIRVLTKMYCSDSKGQCDSMQDRCTGNTMDPVLFVGGQPSCACTWSSLGMLSA